MPPRARYDGYADWYETWNKPHAERNASGLQDLLGPGQLGFGEPELRAILHDNAASLLGQQ